MQVLRLTRRRLQRTPRSLSRSVANYRRVELELEAANKARSQYFFELGDLVRSHGLCHSLEFN